MVKTSPEQMHLCLSQLQKYLKNYLTEDSPENKFQKKFNNLKACVTSSKVIMSVFEQLGNCGTCFKVDGYEDIVTAYESGYIEMETWKGLQDFLKNAAEDEKAKPKSTKSSDKDDRSGKLQDSDIEASERDEDKATPGSDYESEDAILSSH